MLQFPTRTLKCCFPKIGWGACGDRGRRGLKQGQGTKRACREDFFEFGGVVMRVIFVGEGRACSQQFCWIFLLAFLLVMPAMAFGQGYFGTVTGVLTDPTGAVIQIGRASCRERV